MFPYLRISFLLVPSINLHIYLSIYVSISNTVHLFTHPTTHSSNHPLIYLFISWENYAFYLNVIVRFNIY